MNKTLCMTILACAALSLAADPVRQAREQLALVKPEAARRALADLKNNPKYDYAKNAAAIEALISQVDKVKADLEKGDAAAKAAAVQLVGSRTRCSTSTKFSASTARSVTRAARSADAAAA